MSAADGSPLTVAACVAGVALGFLMARLTQDAMTVSTPNVRPGQWATDEPCRSDLCVSFDADGGARVFSSLCQGYSCAKFEIQSVDSTCLGAEFTRAQHAALVVGGLTQLTAAEREE